MIVIKKNTLIFKQGEFGDTAYVIDQGRVEIFIHDSAGEEIVLTVLGHGEIFGEMAVIDNQIRSASARTLDDCQLIPIQKDQIFDILSKSDSLIQLLMRVMLKRTRNLNDSLAGISTAKEVVEPKTNPKMEQVFDKIKLENQLLEAHHNNEFEIHHQPMVDLQTSKIVGSEALIRWNNPSLGMISPGHFIDILENSSMIIPVGYWIFEECFRHYKVIAEKTSMKDFSISINVSGRQFVHYTFLNTLKELVIKHQINPKFFKLELTERILVEGLAVIDILRQCHEMGFLISLDDFGTGFSSMQYLSQMPVDNLKIDRSFVMNVINDKKTESIVHSIIFLGKKLGMSIIAEGLECEAEIKKMHSLGAEFGQGYYFGRSMKLAELIEKINQTP